MKLVAQKSLNIVVKAEKILMGVIMLWITVAIFVQIILRYIFHAPLFGIEEIVILTAAWLYFIGVAYTTKTEGHVKVDIITLFSKNRLFLKWNKLSILSLSIIGSGVLFYVALQHTLWAFEVGLVIPTFMISISYATLSVVVGGGLTFLHFTIQLAGELKDWRNPDPIPS